MIIAAAFDGSVLCYSKAGELIWKNSENTAFPYDLEVADITGDGRDETLLASADGTLHVFDHQGILLWTFSREAPLLQVCVAKNADGERVILTGGIERVLYVLSAKGAMLHSREFTSVIRHIQVGNIMGDGKPHAAVVTAYTPGSQFELRLLDLDRLQDAWDQPLLLTRNPLSAVNQKWSEWPKDHLPVFSMLICDFDGDGAEDIALSAHFEEKGIFRVYDHCGDQIVESPKLRKLKGPYRMNLLTRVRLGKGRTAQDRIMGLYGNQLFLYGMDGSIEQVLSAPYSLACSAFDPESSTLYFGSSISGGDGIYGLRLDRRDWAKHFEHMQPEAALAKIEKNIEQLITQIDRFERPAYQRSPRKTKVITLNLTEASSGINGRATIEKEFLEEYEYQNLEFLAFYTKSENYDRGKLEGRWRKYRDTRRTYRDSAAEIIAFAAEREAKKEPFALWAGHGSDPFYLQLSTLKGMLEAAPTMLQSLVFAELEHADADMEYAVRTHLYPLAELCRKQGVAKIVLRNKNIFWNASCYKGFWRGFLLGGEYKDIFVPSMEETNGRSQAISLSGRQGLWLTGVFDQLSARAVTDNANFGRFWEWGAQQKQTHLIRSLALRASLGADLFLVNIHQGDRRDMSPFYKMIDKGIIAIPEREELLSVSEVCLGMQQPSESFLEQGKNGHGASLYQSGQPPAVFDRLDTYWAGAPTAPYDFSNYAMGSRRRMLNFLPTNPYGLIAMIPAETDLSESTFFKTMLRTDGEVFYGSDGKSISAEVYKPTAEALLKEAAKRLPIRVEGEVAWSVVRLDPFHVRVVLIDSGYTDPADRKARIIIQNLEDVRCRDILSGENVPVVDGAISLTVPAAILRIVDIHHQ